MRGVCLNPLTPLPSCALACIFHDAHKCTRRSAHIYNTSETVSTRHFTMKVQPEGGSSEAPDSLPPQPVVITVSRASLESIQYVRTSAINFVSGVFLLWTVIMTVNFLYSLFCYVLFPSHYFHIPCILGM